MTKHKNLMMMKMTMKICCAAVLALGLAACGSETVAPVSTPAPPSADAPAPDPSIEAGETVRRENGGQDGRHGRSDGGWRRPGGGGHGR